MSLQESIIQDLRNWHSYQESNEQPSRSSGIESFILGLLPTKWETNDHRLNIKLIHRSWDYSIMAWKQRCADIHGTSPKQRKINKIMQQINCTTKKILYLHPLESDQILPPYEIYERTPLPILELWLHDTEQNLKAWEQKSNKNDVRNYFSSQQTNPLLQQQIISQCFHIYTPESEPAKKMKDI